MVMAAGSGVISALTGLFAGGGKSSTTTGVQVQPRLDTSTHAIAIAPDHAARKDAMKNAREERFHALVTDPHVQGLAMVIGGTLLAANMPYHSNRFVNGELRALTASAVMLMGLGRAGVGDMTSMVMAAGTGAVLTGAALADEPSSQPSGSAGGTTASGGLLSNLMNEFMSALWVVS